MFQNPINLYEYLIVKVFGYENAIRIEEIFYGLGMIFLDMLTMAIISVIFILRPHSLKDFGHSKVKLLRIDNGKKSTQIISIRSLKESFEQVILLSFSPFCTIKRSTVRNERHTRRFVRIMFFVAVLVILFAIVAS